MTMNIVVCIKQVPDPDFFDKIAIDPSTGTIRRTGIPVITNPLDRHALEEALRIRDRFGGTVTTVTMGPPQARKSLDDALAVGADRGALLCDTTFAGADTLATACALSGGIRSLGPFNLILCGNETVDGATSQVPAQLAEMLDIPHVTHARKIVLNGDGRAFVERVVENGFLKVEVILPAVIAVLNKINTYRLPTVMGIMEAMGKEILNLDCTACESSGIDIDDLGFGGSPTRFVGMSEAAQTRKVELISGEPKEIAKSLVKKLRHMDAL
jgi:electron transfer flavoprotein beta subunit